MSRLTSTITANSTRSPGLTTSSRVSRRASIGNSRVRGPCVSESDYRAFYGEADGAAVDPGLSHTRSVRRRDKVIVRRNDLPPPAAPHPRIGEPIAAIEWSIRPLARDQEPARHDRRLTEAADAHVLVVRRLHRICAGHDLVQDIVPTHGAVVLAVNEPIGQEAAKHRAITMDQGERPLVLQAQENARLAVLGCGSAEQHGGENEHHGERPRSQRHTGPSSGSTTLHV